MEETRILVVEDEGIVAMDIQNSLEGMGYVVLDAVPSGEEAIERAGELLPDIVLMDIMLKGEMDGIEAAAHIRENYKIPVVYLTAYSDERTLERAKITEPYGYILKPFQERELHTNIEIALYKHVIEHRLKESEERYRLLSENSPSGIFILKGGSLTYANATLKANLERSDEELVGQPLAGFVNEDDRPEYDERMAELSEGKIPHFTAKLLSKHGSRWHDITLAPFEIGGEKAVLGIATDVTEVRALEIEARKAEKIDALMSVSTGLAHEFNDILNRMVGTAQLIQSHTEDPQIQQWLLQIQHEGQRMSQLVKDIMDTKGYKSPTPNVVDMSIFIKGLIQNMKAEMPQGVSLQFEIEPGPFSALATMEDMQLIIQNVVANAVEAIDGAGQVRVRLFVMPDFQAAEIPLPANDYMCIEVTDTGGGIPEDALEKAFDPFFSTKEGHQGLGLSKAYLRAANHQGHVRIETVEGKGTRVRVFFPQRYPGA